MDKSSAYMGKLRFKGIVDIRLMATEHNPVIVSNVGLAHSKLKTNVPIKVHNLTFKIFSV